MPRNFSQELKAVSGACDELRSMPPHDRLALPMDMPESGVYMFSEGGENLYVGRSNRMRERIMEHGRPSSRHNVAALAFRLARVDSGRVTPTYQPEGSRPSLEEDPEFRRAFLDAKARVSLMQVRWTEERDPIRQALLEIFAAVKLSCRHNRFETT